MTESEREELTGMTSDERFNAIAKAVALVLKNQGVPLEGGLMDYTQEDVLDEAEHLDSREREEDEDFDEDENLVDLDTISPEMREACNG